MTLIKIVCVLIAVFSLIDEGESLVALHRIRKELVLLQKAKPPGITAAPVKPDNLWKWTATIDGPAGTPYEGGVFKLDITFPETYPLKAPTVIFTTRIYHSNIDTSGRICLDILKEKWSAALNLKSLLMSIQSLLSDPNHDSPLNGEAARTFQANPQRYADTVRQWTKQYAMPR